MPRRSRVNIDNKPALVTRFRVWRIAIYIRLSKEDIDRKDESESVSNQKKIIKEHIASFNDGDEYIIVDYYIDDGISGTTDDERGNFLRMLEDIERGKVNCVIVKDLARSFRNYADQGYYLDDWFPRHDVRFISMYHQTLDSYKEPQNMRSIAVPIQGVLNENHCAETSDKVRETLDMKRRNGEFIGAFAPYGYKKSPQDKNALIIDEESAEIVRYIFKSFLEGMNKQSISIELNKRGVLSPAQYKIQIQGLNYPNPNIGNYSSWCASTIHNMLVNRVYCGDMVQGKKRIKSYKVHVFEDVPPEKWFVVENTHEPIIPRPTFEKVQGLLKRDTRTAPRKRKLYLFSGFLRCGDCGRSVIRNNSRGYVYYFCRTYKQQSKTACTPHTMRHYRLEAAVLFAIQQQAELAVKYTEIVDNINHQPFVKAQSKELLESIEQKEREKEKILRYKQSLYQDWKDGEITHSDYRHMKTSYEMQEESLDEILAVLYKRRDELENGVDRNNAFLATFRQYQNISALSREILIELVDHIKIFDNERIKVIFNYADELRQVQEFIEVNRHAIAI